MIAPTGLVEKAVFIVLGTVTVLPAMSVIVRLESEVWLDDVAEFCFVCVEVY